MRILLEGPQTLLETIETIGDGLDIRYRAVKDSIDGKYYLGGPEEEGGRDYVPFLFLKTEIASQLAGAGVTGIAELIAGVERKVPNNQVTLTSGVEYNWGIAQGLAYYGGDLVEDAGGLGKFLVHRVSHFGWIYEFTAGDSMQGEFASLAHGKERAAYLSPKLVDFTFRVLNGELALAEALLAGDPAALEAAGPEHWMVKDMIATLLLEGSVAMGNLTWEQKGIVVGYLMPEIVQIVGATAVGTIVGGSVKAAHTLTRLVAVVRKLRTSSKVAGVIDDLAVVEKLEDVLEHAALWPTLEGLKDSDKVFKVLEYHRLLNPSGFTPWEIFERSVPTLKQGGLWSQDLQKATLDDTLKKMFDGYEAGTIPRDKIPDDDALTAVLGNFGEQWCDDFIIKRYRTGLARVEGRVGERTAGVLGRSKERLYWPPGSQTYFIPDGLDEDARKLVEVKNRKRLSLTPQMRAFIEYCRENNYTFELWVRAGEPPAGTKIYDPLGVELDDLRTRGLLIIELISP